MQQRFLLPLATYMLVILLIGSNIFSQLESSTLGWLGTDAMDTMSLRWLLFHPASRFAPVGYNFAALTPNILDHLTAYPLITLFGFPQGDNLWWFCVLLANALSAHLLGKRLGGELGGYWAGALIISSEQLLREVNLHHAPQSMLFFPLLYFWSLLRIKTKQQAIFCGLFLGLTGWCYLYSFLFSLLGSLPLLWTAERKQAMRALGMAGLVLLPNLIWLFWMSPTMIQPPNIGLIQGKTMLEMHSGGWDFLWQNQPFDLSNQISFLALGLSGWMLLKKRAQLHWGVGLFCFGLGAFMLLGAHNPLFPLVHSLPGFSRLFWPERWGILLPIGLVFCSAPFFLYQHRMLWRLPPLVVLEMFLRSGNLPLHSEPTNSYQCYAELKNDQGIILELPMKHNDRLYNRSALYQRLHGRPMINPFILPPMASPPKEWEQWRQIPWLQELDQDTEAPYHSSTTFTQRAEIQSVGITSIIIDRSPFAPLSEQEATAWKRQISEKLGEPVDLGCLWLWQLDTEKSRIQNTKRPTSTAPYHHFPLLMEPINQQR